MEFKEFKEKCYGKTVDEIKEIISNIDGFWKEDIDAIKLVIDSDMLANKILQKDKELTGLFIFKKRYQILFYILKNITNLELIPEDESFDDYNIFMERAILELNNNASFFKTITEEVILQKEKDVINDLYEVFKSGLPTVEEMQDLRTSISNVFKDESPEQLKTIESILAYNDPVMKNVKDVLLENNISDEIANIKEEMDKNNQEINKEINQ